MRISDWSSDVCSSDLHYRVQQTRAPETIARAERPAPPQVAGNVRIAGLNLLNLFNGDGNGGGFPTARGARDVAGYQMQQAKLVAVIQALQPDVAALMEVENDGFGADSALAQLRSEEHTSELQS